MVDPAARLRPALAALRDLVFVPVCLSCRNVLPRSADPPLICSLCWSRCLAPSPPLCARCGSTVPRGAPRGRDCRHCRDLPAALRVLRSAYLHEGPPREMVHALKFGGWQALADPMGRRMAGVALPDDVRAEVSLVVPVPLAPARRRERGYNQAELLALALCRETGWRCDPATLVRRRSTARQSGLQSRERRTNVATAFSVPPAACGGLSGEHVLLVDDVWTTGATALACLAALVEGGARVVSVLTFARASNPREKARPDT
jgi:ComF family protein